MCVGLAQADELVHVRVAQAHVGSLMVLYGAATGRDGIGGGQRAGVRDARARRRRRRGPRVQIGDPFAEKLLIEASLELIHEGLLEGLQDLGGAGITCAVSESAARAGMGAELDLDAVPLREPGMEPFEILTSESQERMLAIVHPSKLAAVEAVCARWGLQTAVIATLVEGGELTVTHARRGGGARCRRARWSTRAPSTTGRCGGPPAPSAAPRTRASTPFEKDLREAFLTVLASPNVAAKRWVFEQYDSVVQGQTVAGAGSDAAVVRVPGR